MKTSRVNRMALGLLLFGATFLGMSRSTNAEAIPLVLTSGPLVNGTQVLSADLAGVGLTEIGLISIVDDGTLYGGADGVFSGFDLDALFIDVDGLLETTSDRFFASNFAFQAGTTRPTRGDTTLEPNAAHPGPTFGSLDDSTIDLAVATLDLFDAQSGGAVDNTYGLLTLGDGGTIDATFQPLVPVGATLFVLIGEVGGQVGEDLGASISASSIPEPGTAVLGWVGLGVLVVATRCRVPDWTPIICVGRNKIA